MPLDLTRLPDWRSRFAAEMDHQRRTAFAWGQHDCALGLACGVVEAITGADLRQGWGNYRTAAGALRALRKRGFESLTAAVADVLPEVHPVYAQIGDIGVIPGDGEIGEALCVVDASGLIVVTEDGHGRRPREDMVRAFKVG